MTHHPNKFYVSADIYDCTDHPIEESFGTEAEAVAWMNQTLARIPKATFGVIYGRVLDVKHVEVAVTVELDK